MEAALAVLKLTLPFGEALPRDAGCDGDAAVIARCQAGDIEAYGILLHRYRDRVVNLAFQFLRDRDDAEDVAQEAFTRAFTSIQTFRGESQLFTWLYRITVNLCLQRKRRAKVWEVYDEITHHADASAAQIESQVAVRLQLAQVLDALPEAFRVVLILHELHDLSYEEIAAVLKLPAGTVASRLSRARQRFRRLWKQQFGEELT